MAKKNNKILKSGSKLKAAKAKKLVLKVSAKKVDKAKVSVSKNVEKKADAPKTAKKERASKKMKIVEAPIIENRDISFAVENVAFGEFITKNIGKHALDIVQNLNDSPQTDDKLSAKLEIKVNEVRRMLNVLNSYSITKYDINKDSKGWLTFKWYLDREKLRNFVGTSLLNGNNNGPHLQENCNDFFFCKGCYENQKVIFPFDTAFETDFKCGECGKALSALNREETQVMVYQETKA